MKQTNSIYKLIRFIIKYKACIITYIITIGLSAGIMWLTIRDMIGKIQTCDLSIAPDEVIGKGVDLISLIPLLICAGIIFLV